MPSCVCFEAGDHKPDLLGLRYVRAVLRPVDDVGERRRVLSVAADPIDDQPLDVGFAERLRTLCHCPVQRDLKVEPEPVGLGVEVVRPLTEHLEGRTEVPDGVPWHGDPEEHPLAFDAFVARTQGRGRPDERRAGDTSRERAVAEERLLTVNMHRGRIGAIDIALNDRLPSVAVVEVAGQLVAYRSRIERDRTRHDEGRVVAGRVQGVHDGAHESQHTARALELLERRPVAIKAVEEFGMDRVRVPDPRLIRGLTRLGRQLADALAVVLDECFGRDVDLPPCCRVGLAEEPSPNDLERFGARRGCPGLGDATDHVLQPFQRGATVRTADLEVGGDRGIVVTSHVGRQGSRRGAAHREPP